VGDNVLLVGDFNARRSTGKRNAHLMAPSGTAF
jgi:endonuclease/exonuclease/phosphatase (EEP) superfamily protein YafD